MEKIKICYVIVNCKITGPMNQTLNIIKNLDLDKFEVSFITLFDEEKDNSMIEQYSKIIRRHICLHLNKISSLIIGKKKVKRALQEIKPDIVHALGMPPYRLSLAYKNCKHLITLRNYAYEDYPSYYNKLIGPILAFFDINLIKKLKKDGKTFITCSKSLSDIYLEREKIALPYIQNGVDTSKFEKKNKNSYNRMREKLNIEEEAVVFIYTGPFIERKDQEFAIRGFVNANIPKKYLILCGDGDKFNELKQKYQKHSNIIFTGKVKNVNDYLMASDIYISTSKSEGMPNSVLEAMATGLPVILSDIPQHLELFDITSNIGYYYKVGDIQDLKYKIEKMDTQSQYKFGEESFNCIKDNLTSTIMSEKYQKLYMRLDGRG